jgi:hypothetical protein
MLLSSRSLHVNHPKYHMQISYSKKLFHNLMAVLQAVSPSSLFQMPALPYFLVMLGSYVLPGALEALQFM